MTESTRNELKGQDSPIIIRGYSLLETLGHGSFATTYRAIKDGREYCVKKQDIHGLDGRTAIKAIELFRREASVLSGLNHPQIPKVYDYFETTGGDWNFYLVQDLVQGLCLKDIVNPYSENGEELARPFEEGKVIDIASQLSAILIYIHNRTPPVVHRDVKPSNIMMDDNGKVSLIDFGIVQQKLINIVDGSTTFGTPGYAPLELCVPGGTTPRSDIYMLGTTILNLASGINPVHLMDNLRRVDYKSKFKFKNPSLEALVDQMTQADPDKRPESAEQVTDYLEKIKAGKSISQQRTRAGLIARTLAKFLSPEVIHHVATTRAEEIATAQRDRHLVVFEQNVVPGGKIEVLSSEVKIDKTDEYWTFHGVPLIGQGNKESVFRVTRGLLFDGKLLRQKEYIQRLQGSELVLPTVPEYLSLCAYLERFKDHPVPEQKKKFEEAKAWLGKMFNDFHLVTGTRAVYNPNGGGKVIHGGGRKDAFTTKVPVYDREHWIKRMGNPNQTIEALCGTGDIVVVNQSFRFISGKDTDLYLMIKPSKKRENPVNLGVYGNGINFSINSDHLFANFWHVLGMVTPQVKNGPRIQRHLNNRLESTEQVADYLEQIKAGKSISQPKTSARVVARVLAKPLPREVLHHVATTRAEEIATVQRDRIMVVSDSSRIEILSGEAKIEKTDDYWTFHGVPLIGQRNKESVLRVTRGLLFDGKHLQQEEYIHRLQGNELVLPTVPEYLSLCAYLGQFKDHPVPEQKKLFEEAKIWLEVMFKKHWLMTGTKAAYNQDSTSSGKVIQGVGRKDAFTAKVPALIGPDNWIKRMGNPDTTIEALCGTGDIAVVNQSFRYISGKDSYLWRNSYVCHTNGEYIKPEERQVVLGVNIYTPYNRFDVVAVDSIVERAQALGVVTPQKIAIGNNRTSNSW